MLEREDTMEVLVWDLPTRVLHWAMALLISTLILLALGHEVAGWFGADEELEEGLMKIHAYAGHLLVVVFVMRVIWGFAGNEYARWSDMNPFRGKRLKEIGDNIRWYLGGCRTAPPRHIGHNPLASLFYIALFLVLAGQSLTGIFLSGEEFGMFPGRFLAALPGHGVVEVLEEAALEVHEFGLLFILFFIIAHTGGLVLHEMKDRGAILYSIFTGKKYFSVQDK